MRGGVAYIYSCICSVYANTCMCTIMTCLDRVDHALGLDPGNPHPVAHASGFRAFEFEMQYFGFVECGCFVLQWFGIQVEGLGVAGVESFHHNSSIDFEKGAGWLQVKVQGPGFGLPEPISAHLPSGSGFLFLILTEAHGANKGPQH